MAKTILIVDDAPSIRQVVTLVLGNEGYKVVEAEDGYDALTRLRTRSVDLVITDVNMPNMDGITLVEEMRRMRSAQLIPVIMLTTDSLPAQKDKGHRAGARAWIAKPFRAEQLQVVVSMLVGE